MGRFDTGRQGVKASKDELPLAEQTARRLLLADIQPDDPGLAFIREWNAAVYAKAMQDPEYRQAVERQWQNGAGSAAASVLRSISPLAASAEGADENLSQGGTPTT